MNALPNHTALKEWSSVVESLGRGDQVILLRKGGIADVSFGVEAERFYLYPTYFHQGETEPRAQVPITHWCEVVSTWTTRDHDVLGRLEPFVAIPRETLEARFRFRSDQALHLIAVRTFVLPAPAEIAFREAYAGCLSWISIEEEIDVEGSRPSLLEAELRAKIDLVSSELSVARAGSAAR
jgi:hypothetical protein